MAKAQATSTIEHYDLKTCEGGWVKLRRFSYGESLERKSKISLSFAAGKGSDNRASMDMASKEVAFFEFSRCVVEHNLEKEDGTLFNFKNKVDLLLLDPRIGEEIESYINKLNNFEDDEGN